MRDTSGGDRVALVEGNGSNGKASSSTAGYVQRFVFLLFCLVCLSMYALMKEEQPTEQQKQPASKTKNPLSSEECVGMCHTYKTELQKQYDGHDLTSLTEMKTVAIQQQEKLFEMLKKDYGQETFDKIWSFHTKGKTARQAFQSANETRGYSTRYFKRKIMMKLLSVQMAILQQQNDVQGCNCAKKEGSRLGDGKQDGEAKQEERRLQNKVNITEAAQSPSLVQNHYDQFVWATGGHSAAAGHGNLYNESYTAYLERAVGPLFQSLGIEFIGRNYAMGGMDSAPHIAMCLDSIMGTDVDLISWDFGMTDGRAYWKLELYTHRIGIHRNRPVALAINLDGRQFRARRDRLARAEDMGAPALYLDPKVQEYVLNGIPDMYGMTQEQMDAYPPFARYFKCNKQVEKDEPHCADEKYSKSICPKRSFRAGWHPGWRVMALTGNIMALQVSELVIESLKELEQEKDQSPFSLHAKLKAEEDRDYLKLRTSTIPENEENGMVKAEMIEHGVPVNPFFRNNAICHTALLPAQSRYLGILTEQPDKVGMHGYDNGINFEGKPPKQDTAPDNEKTSSFALAYEKKSYQTCPVDLNMDHKDFFVVTENDGWTSLVLPNDSEMKAYGQEEKGKAPFDPLGLVMACFMKCDWGKCPPGEINKENGFDLGLLELQVNGDLIVNITGYSEWAQCSVLYGQERGYYHKANADGKFEIKAKVNKKEGDAQALFSRFMAFIIL